MKFGRVEPDRGMSEPPGQAKPSLGASPTRSDNEPAARRLDLDVPPCRRTSVCLLPDRHDGYCQPATRREQREIRRVLAKAGKP